MTELVVIGGSAGALDALLALAAVLPPELTAPIVIVLHISPNQKNLLPDLLARASSHPAREIDDKQPLEPGCIHVAPPNYHVLVEKCGELSLSVDDPVQFSRPSIDVLFESAAHAFGPRVTGVVLSGANADGAAGLAQIAAAGGRAYVQAPETAAQRAMPLAALASTPTAVALTISDLGRVLAAGRTVP